MAVHLNVASRACLQASICDKLGVRERLSISIRQVSVHLWDPSGSDKIVRDFDTLGMRLGCINYILHHSYYASAFGSSVIKCFSCPVQ